MKIRTPFLEEESIRFLWNVGKRILSDMASNSTFIGPYIANTFAEYNQQVAKFLNLFISVRRCTCFRRVFLPSSGAQNCTYSVRYLSDRYCYLLLAWLATGSSNRNFLFQYFLTEWRYGWVIYIYIYIYILKAVTFEGLAEHMSKL